MYNNQHLLFLDLQENIYKEVKTSYYMSASLVGRQAQSETMRSEEVETLTGGPSIQHPGSPIDEARIQDAGYSL